MLQEETWYVSWCVPTKLFFCFMPLKLFFFFIFYIIKGELCT